MAALIGFLIVATLAIGAAMLVAGRHHVVRRDPSFGAEGAMVLIGFLLLAVLGLA